ncbi:hypothetical protein LIER_08423 [Lithospermum erythrorhizon]|uniref:RNA-directed DNA polymerase (Reverse transcriptase) n=1 Tax=Lithospermum erythrorhizon TaxID=34254 RepID=A0AAV3PFU5_LITER
MFADDTLLLGQATISEARVIRDLLCTYESWSGQLVNVQKSTILFSSNVPAHTRNEIGEVLPHVATHGKYLGLPSSIGSSKKEVFNSIIDRVKTKVDDWKSRLLSKAGKEAWRLITEPNNHLSRSLKARYYPDGDFFSWKLGNGRSINVWHHKWVQHTHTHKVITPIDEEFKDLRVSDLIDQEVGVWDVVKINMFYPVDSEAILQIPLNNLDAEDLPV